MAYANTLTDHYPKEPSLGWFGRMMTRMIERAADNHPQLRRVRALQALSDDALAARGIRRADIVSHVFRGYHFY